MTMTPERLAELDADASKIGLPICPEWTYSAIRHCQRNMDIDVTAGFNEPDRQCGGSIAEIVNAYADLRAHIDAQAETIARLREALQGMVRGCDYSHNQVNVEVDGVEEEVDESLIDSVDLDNLSCFSQ